MTNQRLRVIVASLILVASIALRPSTVAAQSSQNQPDSPASPPTSQNDISRQLVELKQAVDEKDSWRSPKTIAPIIVGLIAAIFGSVAAFWSALHESETQRKGRHQQHLFDSLKWFDEHTTGRGIGIAIISANWDRDRELRRTWTSILVWQASYLIGQSTRKRESTEVTNLHNMCRLLQRADLTEDQRKDIGRALENRKKSDKGHDLEPEELKPWQQMVRVSG